MKLGEIIQAHRRLSGLSRKKLAELAGVGKTAIFDLEHEKNSARLSTLEKVLSVLNICLEYKSPLMEEIIADSKSKNKKMEDE